MPQRFACFNSELQTEGTRRNSFHNPAAAIRFRTPYSTGGPALDRRIASHQTTSPTTKGVPPSTATASHVT
jgi:hypothetical protein